MPKLQIGLDEKHYKALLDLAKQEYRNPRDQAGLIVKNELEKQGMMPDKDSASSTSQPNQNMPTILQENKK